MELNEKLLNRLTPYHREVVQKLQKEKKIQFYEELSLTSREYSCIIFSNCYAGDYEGNFYVLTDLVYLVFPDRDVYEINTPPWHEEL